ncbi:nicotinate-nucleotide adenylyltransferase [Cylindrospermopsis curvispora]|uniref:nicotinate-nucleotide adenylyltransferase n=1 Tax=Cylindrospermopsis curvispora GIHE-G1 TaxID=2666332 RepID=A0A7H0F3E3_9CYAN|nr:nicotinate-nucleotide adenylyltransferase [Cylindrospermopsis curvispora]QNP30559.1 nicotinate-nucleotide adenylyltransferase [Cylindrospermopsis curvispora GIHE-G1]
MNIALFGTSADPPTAGHQKIIKWLCENYDWVAVWAADNPIKEQQTPLGHRAAMLQLLISDIEPPLDKLNNIILAQELSSWRTLETLERAKLKWGDDVKYTLVIGSDLVNQLPRWYRISDLLQQVQLLVIPRPGYIIEDASLHKIRQLGGKMAIASTKGLNVSSTNFRQQKNLQTLTAPVIAYINRERLYI